MNPGELNRRVTIQQQTQQPDSFGEVVENWIDICTVWASVKSLTGKEFFEAEKMQSEVTNKIKIRYRDDIKSSMRVKYKDRVFLIMYKQNFNEQNKELLLFCKESGG